MEQSFISVTGIKKTFGLEKKIVALNEVSYSFPTTGLISIVGRSGCGKTTLLYALSGLIETDAGKIEYNGQDISNLTESEWENFRNLHVGIVFQDFQLFENDTVENNLKLVLDIRKDCLNHAELIQNALKYVDLDGYQKRKVQNLSGGEKQRVAIARALIKRSSYILADEPTGHLDNNTGKEIWELLKKISADRLVIVVSHDNDSAQQYSDCLLYMKDGEINKNVELNRVYLRFWPKNGESFVVDTVNKNEIVECLLKCVKSGEKDFHIEFTDVKTNNDIPQTNDNKPQMVLKPEKKDEESSNQIKGMSLRKIADFSFDLISKRKIRQCLTIFMMALSLLVSLAVFSIFDFDPYVSVKKYIDDYSYSIFRIGKDVSYVDSFYQINQSTIFKGKYFNELMNLGFSDKEMMGVKTNDTLEVKNGLSVDDIRTVFSDIMLSKTIEGNWAQNDKEIVLTDYLSTVLNVNIGDMVARNGRELTVCGIIATDFQQYGYIEKEIQNILSDIGAYKYITEYGYVVVTKDFPREELFDLDVEGADFTSSEKMSLYSSSLINFAPYEENDKLLAYGNGINNHEKDVIVNNEMLWRLKQYSFDDAEDIFETVKKDYNFIDLYDEKFCEYYSGYLNMYDLYPDGVTIVGVVEDSGEESAPKVFISGEKWEELKEKYNRCYFDEIWVECDSDQLVQSLREFDLKYDEPHALEIFEISNTMNELKVISIVTLVIVVLLSSIMLINTVAFGIGDSLHGLGILRSLGVRKSDTLKIFFLENIIITVAALALSTIMYLLALRGVNSFVKKEYSEYPFDLFVIRPQYFMAVLLIAFLGTMMLVFIPISKYSNKKTAELLHEVL